MAERKKAANTDTTTDAENRAGGTADDFGADQVRDAFNEAQQQGYFGQKVDPLPNSAHSLESGPEAPTVAEQHAASLRARADQFSADTNQKED